VITVINLKQL